MKMYSVIFAAAAICASATTVGVAIAPAHAAKAPEEVVVTGRSNELPTAIVQYADLNLGSEAGRERLDRRIGYAARQLCGERRPVELYTWSDIDACHSAVQASAKPQVKALMAALESGQKLALGDVGALTLSAK
jgi:UrcA family protein